MRVSQIRYKDLLATEISAILIDLLIWVPWLIIAWAALLSNFWYLAIPAWFFFFLTGLRQAHESFHRTMGIPDWLYDFLLALLSPLMLSCLHATRYAHLQHHRFCLDIGDIEGEGAHLSALQAILRGPLYPFRSHRAAWNLGGTKTRNWMKIEIALIVGFYASGFYWFPQVTLPHFLAMLAGEWMVSFFAVWMVHHNCENETNPSRTIRGLWRKLLSYSMFYHHEHHAYPRVPTRKLAELARRLDAAGHASAKRAF